MTVAISKIYAVPFSAVLALKAADVADGGGVVLTLWPAGLALDLAPTLAEPLRRWAAWDGGGHLFPGRNGVQPLSRDAVRHHAGSGSALFSLGCDIGTFRRRRASSDATDRHATGGFGLVSGAPNHILM